MATVADPNHVKGSMVIADQAAGLNLKTLFGPQPDRKLNCNLAVLQPGGRTMYHSHEWEQVNYILKGSGEAHVGNDEVLQIESGNVIHFAANEQHCFENTGAEIMEILGVLGPMGQGVS